MSLAGKVAIVTDSSVGIGEAIAKILLKKKGQKSFWVISKNLYGRWAKMLSK